MNIILYEMNQNENTINKSKTEIVRYSIAFKNDVDIVNPEIRLRIGNDVDMDSMNYCYIDEVDRYYFIRDIRNVTRDVFNFICECDVLETYKTEILTGKGYIESEIKTGDYQNVSINTDVRKEIEKYLSNKEIENNDNYIMSTVVG